MKYTKPFISFQNQLTTLEEKGLIINDKKNATNFLSSVSFYRLRAYTYPFQDNTIAKHPFVQKISFEEIISLYKFDRKLRILIFGAIEKIEIALRTQIIYHFASIYGSHWQSDPKLYRDVARFATHLETLNKEIERSDETFISHYKTKYTSPSQPPCWMSLEVASLGTLSKLFQNLIKGEAKENVMDYFGLKDIAVLENWMFCFSGIRNICAHHGRLWNRRLTAIPILPYVTKNQFLSKKEGRLIFTNKLYATLCCMCYMLKAIDPESNFHESIKKIMSENEIKQDKEMGFAENWQNHPLWN
jgi:abortive infection bacteriophage resistance protein